MKIHFPTVQFGFFEDDVPIEQVKDTWLAMKRIWEETQEEDLKNGIEKNNSKLPLGNKSALKK